MFQQVGFQIIVIFEPDAGNGLSAENGGIGPLVDLILLPVTHKEVLRNHKGKGNIRLLCFQLRGTVGGGMAQFVHAWNAAEGRQFLTKKVLVGMADGT